MGTQHKALSLCQMQSFREGLYFSVLAVMQWDLSEVWSQSSLILPKASDQTGGLIWKPVANTKDQTFHLCIFLEQCQQLDNVYISMRSHSTEQVIIKGKVVRVDRSVRCQNIQVSRYHERWTAAVQSLMLTLKSIQHRHVPVNLNSIWSWNKSSGIV